MTNRKDHTYYEGEQDTPSDAFTGRLHGPVLKKHVNFNITGVGHKIKSNDYNGGGLVC